MSLDEIAANIKKKHRDKLAIVNQIAKTFQGFWLRGKQDSVAETKKVFEFIFLRYGLDVHAHYSQIIRLERYAREDICDMLTIEDGGLLKLAATAGKGAKWNQALKEAFVNEERINRFLHSYYLRLGSIVDNQYGMIEDYYALKVKHDLDYRKNMQSALKEVNQTLRKHMKKELCFSNQQYLINQCRDANAHNYQGLNARAVFDLKDFFNTYHMELIVHDTQFAFPDMFKYLASDYQHVLQNTTNAMILTFRGQQANEGRNNWYKLMERASVEQKKKLLDIRKRIFHDPETRQLESLIKINQKPKQYLN